MQLPDAGQVSIESRRERIKKLLAPDSIAFIGGNWVSAGIAYCRQLGYPGRIIVVNPKRGEIGGIACVPTIDEMPIKPDVAFVCINKNIAIDIIAGLNRLGVAGAVCNAAGFGEIGDGGKSAEAELERAAGDMLLLGPNSPGYVNFHSRAAVAMERFGLQPAAPGVALISQGGAIMQDLIASSRDLPLTHMIGVGNQLDLSIPDCIDALLDDQQVRGFALYLEAMPDVTALGEVALKAQQRGVPIVVLKSGRSDSGTRAMFSHTASMTSPKNAVDAVFERFGLIPVRDLPEMLETLKFLVTSGAPRGRRTAIVTASGMHSALAADAAEAAGLDVAYPSAASLEAQREVLPDIATPGNPLDLTTYYWGQREPQAHCYRALFADDYDIALSVTNYPIPDTWDLDAWEQGFFGFVDVVGDLEISAATVTLFPESFPPAAKSDHVDAGIAPLQGLTESMRAVANAVNYGESRRRILARARERVLLPACPAQADPAEIEILDEHAAKSRLAAAGVAVPANQRLRRGDADGFQLHLAGPCAVKLLHPELAHKTELGAVRLGVDGGEAVLEAMRDIERDLSAANSELGCENFLVEEMIDDGLLELCVGVTRIDGIGLLLTLGAGGTLTELMPERASLLLPAAREDFEAALAGLNLARLIDGYRGKTAADGPALIDTLVAIGEFAETERGRLLELEINPLILRPRGAVAVDAFLRLGAADRKREAT